MSTVSRGEYFVSNTSFCPLVARIIYLFDYGYILHEKKEVHVPVKVVLIVASYKSHSLTPLSLVNLSSDGRQHLHWKSVLFLGPDRIILLALQGESPRLRELHLLTHCGRKGWIYTTKGSPTLCISVHVHAKCIPLYCSSCSSIVRHLPSVLYRQVGNLWSTCWHQSPLVGLWQIKSSMATWPLIFVAALVVGSSVKAENILGSELLPCCNNCGFYRQGKCTTDAWDQGRLVSFTFTLFVKLLKRRNDVFQGTHVVCAIMTNEFLAFTKSEGNDLSTPHPEMQVKSFFHWC